MSDNTPEHQRVEELLARVHSAEATEAEREELALYAADNPALQERIASEEHLAALGAGWLERVEADRQLKRQERTPWVKVERGLGLGLLGAGTVLGFVSSAAAPILLLGGTGVLLWSFVRVRLQTLKHDRYRDIEQ